MGLEPRHQKHSNLKDSKGQIISKANFESKIERKYFSISALGLKIVQIKKRIQMILLDDK